MSTNIPLQMFHYITVFIKLVHFYSHFPHTFVHILIALMKSLSTLCYWKPVSLFHYIEKQWNMSLLFRSLHHYHLPLQHYAWDHLQFWDLQLMILLRPISYEIIGFYGPMDALDAHIVYIMSYNTHRKF